MLAEESLSMPFFIDKVVCILQEIQYTNKLGSPDSDPDKFDLQCGCV